MAGPSLFVAHHGLAGFGVALVAYADGLVLLEDSDGAHRCELFSSLDEAAEALGLPLRLPSGDLALKTDRDACCPTFQVLRFRSEADPGFVEEPVVVTRVRYGFGADEAARGAADFRAFRARVAAHGQRTARRTKSLASRLQLTEEAFAYAASAEGVDSLEERLQLLGLSTQGETDESWIAEVRQVTDAIRARGLVTAEVLREVLSGQPERSASSAGIADLSGWDQRFEVACSPSPSGYVSLSIDNLASLREWLARRRPQPIRAASAVPQTFAV